MQKSEQGFTLIELLISVTIALIISAAMFGIYANSAGTSAAMLKSSKLNQELYSLMLVMSNDIRRAGYWANPAADLNYFERPQDNPFSLDATELSLIASTDDYVTSQIKAGNSGDEARCVLYAFDQDGDGALDKEEIFGFRLRDNAVEMRIGWNDYDPADPAFSVINDDCSLGNWEAVTDPNQIRIRELTFKRNQSQCINAVDNSDCYTDLPDADEITVETRQVNIVLAAELVSDPAVRASIEQDVRIRNDRVREY
jgi:type IV pilus assembly protein PilW